MSTKQVGSGLLTKGAPKFTDYVVVDGTWKEKANDAMLRTDDGDGAVYNYSGWRAGVDASCEVVVKAGEAPLAKLDVLAEASPGTRSFVVIDVETSSFGGSPLKQTLQLAYHAGFSATPVV